MITAAEALEKAKTIGGKDGLNCIAGLVDTTESSSEGPLAGVPVLVKDNIDVAGFPTTAGSLAMEDNMAETDEHIINNILKKGDVIIGSPPCGRPPGAGGPSRPGRLPGRRRFRCARSPRRPGAT